VKISAFAPYRRWWAGMFAASIGRYTQLVALGAFFAVTEGVLLSALVAAAAFGPGVLGAPLGGAAADRFSPRRVALIGIGTQALAGGAVLVGLLAGFAPGVILGFLAVQGFGLAFSTPASGLLLQAAVPDTALEQAIGAGGFGSELGRFLGAAAAWVLLGGAPVIAVLFHVASLLFMLVAYRSLPTPQRRDPPDEHPAGRSTLLEVLRSAGATPGDQRGVQAALAGTALVHLLAVSYLGLAAARAAGVVDPVQVSSYTAAMLALAGLGAAGASAYFARRVRRDRLPAMLWRSALLAGVSTAAWGINTNPYLLVALAAVLGASTQLFIMGCALLVHLHAQLNVRGRVLGMNRALTDLCYAAALAGQGYLVQRFGFGALTLIGVTFTVGGILISRRTPPAAPTQPDLHPR
jgi:MFS family permease